MFNSTNAIEIKISITFTLGFAHNTILSWFFLFFFIIDLCSLIPAVNSQIFNPTAELAIPTATPNNEAKVESETHLLIVEHA